MKRISVGLAATMKFFAAISTVTLLTACDPSAFIINLNDVKINVVGTEGLRFSGSIGTLSGTRSVSGVIPDTFSVTLDKSLKVVSAVIQKEGGDGVLTVEIRAGSKLMESSSTGAQYGVASVTHTF